MAKLKQNLWIWSEDLTKEFEGANARATAAIGASFLEWILGTLLKAYFIEHKAASRLLEDFGPLSTFAARTEISFALGLVSQVEHTNLTLLRKIRNHFAHDLDVSKFSDPAIKTLCDQLEITSKTYSPDQYHIDLLEPIDLTIPGSDRPRERFMAAYGYLQLTLGTRLVQALRNQRTVPEPLSVAEAMRISLKEFDSQLAILNELEGRSKMHDPSRKKGKKPDTSADSEPDLVSLAQIMRPFTEGIIAKLEEAYRESAD